MQSAKLAMYVFIKHRIMKRLLYILNILLGILFFASCEEESAFMPSDNVPCYTILVSTDDSPSTRAHYEENGDKIVVSWDKGDRIKLKNENGEYDFIFRKMVGNDGEFFHYGEIPDSASWSGTVSYGNPLNENLYVQTQEKNNKCCEYLVGEATRIVLKRNSKPTVSLLPAKLGDQDMSLLHIQTTSPGMFIGTSQLKIKGLDKADKNKEYLVNLGSDPRYVFADQGDKLDIYVAVPAGFSINNNQKLEFYFYAYNEETGTTEGGDEYRYNMKCTRNISVSKNEVLKMPLPDRAKSILHITGKAPGEIPAGSMLIIEGWKQEAKELFPVQVDKDGDIDMYVTMPDLAKITSETDLRIYIYAYDRVTGKWETGDEYHYYFEYPGASSSAIVNIQLPDQPTHTAIQLGVSVKWATMNIGATSDQPGRDSYGGYFPWGTVDEDYQIGWGNQSVTYFANKNANDIADFFPYDRISTTGFQGLYKEYQGRKYGDAATYHWGDGWVTPNLIQMRELFDLIVASRDRGKQFTDWVSWKNSQAKPSGQRPTNNGWWVYGKGSYNDKKIWLPAAGHIHNIKPSWNNDSPASSDGYLGVYMTSMPNPNSYSASYNLFFDGHSGGSRLGDYAYEDVVLPSNPYETYNGRFEGSYFECWRHHSTSVRPIRKPN